MKLILVFLFLTGFACGKVLISCQAPTLKDSDKFCEGLLDRTKQLLLSRDQDVEDFQINIAWEAGPKAIRLAFKIKDSWYVNLQFKKVPTWTEVYRNCMVLLSGALKEQVAKQRFLRSLGSRKTRALIERPGFLIIKEGGMIGI